VSVKVHISSKMEPIVVGMLSTLARTVAPIAFSRQSQRMRKASNTPCYGLAWSVVAYMEWHGSLPWRGKPSHAGSKRMSRTCLMSKKPFYLRHRMTFSNWMKSGVLCAKKITNDGCGQRCAAERAKLWASPLATEAKPPASVCGRAFQMNTSTATPSVIFGRPTNTFSRLKPIIVLGRKLGRLRIWNGGITPYANGLGTIRDRRYPFPSPMSIIIWSLRGLLFSIIWTYHLQSNHYRGLKPGFMGCCQHCCYLPPLL